MTMEFENLLEEVIEQAELAAREGRERTFREHLETIEQLVVDTLTYRAQLATVGASSITSALYGWGPEGQLRSEIRGLGRTAIGADSIEIATAWLYFPQKALRKSRYLDLDRGDISFLYLPWYQAAGDLEGLPKGVDPWIRWREYVRELNMFLETTAVESVFGQCASEAVQFLKFARYLVARVPPQWFGGVAGLVDELGGHGADPRYMLAARRQQGAAPDYKGAFTRQLLDLKRVFWLGWLGQTLRRLNRGGMTEDHLLAEWSRVSPIFPDFASVVAAWKPIGSNDIFDWEGEESSRRVMEAQAMGEEAGVMAVDQFAGTTKCVVLLGLRMGTLRGDPDLVGESGLLPHFIQPELDRVAREGVGRWGDLIGASNEDQFANRITELRAQLTEAADLKEGKDQRRLADLPIDPGKAAELVQRLTAGIDIQGIRLISRLRELERVSWSDNPTPAEEVFRWGLEYPKEALIAGATDVVVVAGAIPLHEFEDDWLLRKLFHGKRIARAEGLEAAGRELDRTIDSLEGSQLPASLIVVPWDWELTAHLLRRDGQDPQLAPEGNAISTYRRIELIRGLQWQSRDLIFVLSVVNLGRFTIPRPEPPEVKERFHVEVRPPTEVELEEAMNKPAPRSMVGLPFAGPDLLAYLGNVWRIDVSEHVRFDAINRRAARAIRVVR